MFLFWTQIVRVLETVLDWLLKSNVRCSRDISVLLMPSNRFAISCLQSLLTSITITQIQITLRLHLCMFQPDLGFFCSLALEVLEHHFQTLLLMT